MRGFWCGHSEHLLSMNQTMIKIIGQMCSINCISSNWSYLRFASLNAWTQQLLNTNILQGSVATHLTCGEVFTDETMVKKNFENRLRFDRVTATSLASLFGTQCRLRETKCLLRSIIGSFINVSKAERRKTNAEACSYKLISSTQCWREKYMELFADATEKCNLRHRRDFVRWIIHA